MKNKVFFLILFILITSIGGTLLAGYMDIVLTMKQTMVFKVYNGLCGAGVVAILLYRD